MTKASDNAFPSILITEGTEPSAPAAGKQRLYIDSTTHKLKRTDSSGTDVTVEGGLADTGTVTYLDFTTAAAPSSPAAGKIRVYSKTGDHLAQKDSSGTETLLDQAGGGALTQAYVGYNTVGSSTDTPGVNSKAYAKKVTIATACLITSIEAHVGGHTGTSTLMIGGWAIYDDNAGAVGKLIASGDPGQLKTMTTTFRWYDFGGVGLWVTAADYWLAIRTSDSGGAQLVDIKYDGSGSDVTWSSTANRWDDAPSTTGTSNKFSIRANTIR